MAISEIKRPLLYRHRNGTMSAFSYGGVGEKNANTTWESLLTKANNDFVSVLVLWYSGIMPASTYAWMFPHTLEKYLKSYLLRKGAISSKDLNKFGKNGHSLLDIWMEFKSARKATTSKELLNQSFDRLVEELNTITPNLRYTGNLSWSSDKLLYFYVVLCSLLRYLLIGKDKYRSSLYGLDGAYFLPMNHSPMSIGYGEMIVKKMLHIALEHAGAFTNLGTINQMPFQDYSISNTAIFEKLDDCPICNSGPTDQLSLIKFYRSLPLPTAAN